MAKEQAKFQVLKKSQAEVLSKKKIRKRSGYLQDVVNALSSQEKSQRKVINKQSFNKPAVIQLNLGAIENNPKPLSHDEFVVQSS